MNKRTVVNLICTLTVAVAAWTATQAVAQSSPQPFKLLFIGALSGPAGAVGKYELVGYQAGVDEINARGGILGRRIEVTAEDSAGQGTRAVSALQDKLNAGQKPDAVIAGAISNETLALLPVTTQNKIISMSVTGTTLANNPALYPYNFHGTLNYSDYAKFLAGYLKGHGFKRIGLLVPNDANGQATGKAEKDEMEKSGLVVIYETYATADLDLTPPVQRIADARPDAMVYATLLPNLSPLVLEARYKVGLGVPTYADVNMNGDPAALVPLDRQNNNFLAVAKIAVYRSPAQRNALYNRFFDGVMKGGPVSASLLTPALAWDNIQAMALAYAQAGTTDPDRVKEAFENLNLPVERDRRFMAWKGVRFSPTNHFNTDISPDDFSVIPLGPRIDGGYKPGG